MLSMTESSHSPPGTSADFASLDFATGCRSSPPEFESMSSEDIGESGQLHHGRGEKHGVPIEELKRGYATKPYDSTASAVSTGSSLLQEISPKQLRSGGCRTVGKGQDPAASEERDDTGAVSPRSSTRARRCLKNTTLQSARYKKVMCPSMRTDSTPPDSQSMLQAPRTPPTGRPQPGALLGNAAARVDSAGKAYHQEVVKVQKALEVLQVDRSELSCMEKIGTGSTADVFKGTWSRRPGEELAIKRLNMSTKRSAQLRQEVALLREIALLASIEHDNLVKFYGFAFEERPNLLITEFCQGGPVFLMLHVTDPIQLVIEQQLKMCADVACAMNFLHSFQPQIIHRDLKSLNLLLMETITSADDVPHVKVSDFGLSKMKDEDAGWDDMTVGVGTAHWMAPEVATGNYNEKADIYSFAMVLFEIICNEIPFEDLSTVAVLLSTSQGFRPDLHAIPDRTPTDLVELMQQCWVQEPSHRPSFEYISGALRTMRRSNGVLKSWGESLSVC